MYCRTYLKILQGVKNNKLNPGLKVKSNLYKKYFSIEMVHKYLIVMYINFIFKSYFTLIMTNMRALMFTVGLISTSICLLFILVYMFCINRQYTVKVGKIVINFLKLQSKRRTDLMHQRVEEEGANTLLHEIGPSLS